MVYSLWGVPQAVPLAAMRMPRSTADGTRLAGAGLVLAHLSPLCRVSDVGEGSSERLRARP